MFMYARAHKKTYISTYNITCVYRKQSVAKIDESSKKNQHTVEHEK